MTAHPKIDPRTGEMHAFSCDWQKEPFLTYFRVTPDGAKGAEVPITLREPNLMHDFAITENYAIFPETQMVFRLQVSESHPQFPNQFKSLISNIKIWLSKMTDIAKFLLLCHNQSCGICPT